MIRNRTPVVPEMGRRDFLFEEGLCGCGCGGRTKIAQATVRRYGHTKGKPLRFIRGHSGGRKKSNTCIRCGGPYDLYVYPSGKAKHRCPTCQSAYQAAYRIANKGRRAAYYASRPDLRIFAGATYLGMADTPEQAEIARAHFSTLLAHFKSQQREERRKWQTETLEN